jgi:ParB/RepB/Spo0J family partition protein
MNPFDIVMVGGSGPNDVPDSPELHHLYDKRVHLPISDELVESILSVGVIQPIKVVKYGNVAHLVVGRQRLGACRKIRETRNPVFEIPVITVKNASPDKLYEMILAENNARLAENPMELLEKVDYYMVTWQKSEAEAARAVGKSGSYVNKLLRIHGLAPSILADLKAGRVGVDAVLPLIDKTPEEQVAAYQEVKNQGVKPTRRRVSEVAGKVVAPGRRTVLKMLGVEQDKRPTIKPEYDSFWGALQLMTGQVSVADVGLGDFVAKLSEKPAKPVKDPNAPKKPRGRRSKKTIAENAADLTTALEGLGGTAEVTGTTEPEPPGDDAQVPPRPITPAKKKGHPQATA